MIIESINDREKYDYIATQEDIDSDPFFNS